MADKVPETEMGQVAATTKPQTESVEAIDNPLIANSCGYDNRVVAFRAADGGTWSYRGKRGRVLAMLVKRPEGMTQHDTYPWHTRLGGTIHALRKDGLTISTEIVGRYRHARYRLATFGSLIIHPINRERGL